MGRRARRRAEEEMTTVCMSIQKCSPVVCDDEATHIIHHSHQSTPVSLTPFQTPPRPPLCMSMAVVGMDGLRRGGAGLGLMAPSMTSCAWEEVRERGYYGPSTWEGWFFVGIGLKNGEGKEEGEWGREGRRRMDKGRKKYHFGSATAGRVRGVELWEEGLEALFCWRGELKSIRSGRWRV